MRLESGLRKVAEFVESSAKQSLATAVIDKNMNSLDILTPSSEPWGPKLTSHHAGEDSTKQIYGRSNMTRPATALYLHLWKRV